MDERSLILKAIKNKHKNTEEVDFNFPEPDAIDKWVKRKNRQESHKQKDPLDWSNADFLNYLDSMLKDFGARRTKGNLRSDSNTLNRLYDAFIKHLNDKMNNTVLKDYMDWWCSIWASRLTGSEMHLNVMIQDYQIKKFVSRYNEENAKEILSVPAFAVDDKSIFGLGGLDLLVMKRGIVAGYRMLREQGVTDPAQVMRNTLSSFEKDALLSVMGTTIQFAPYKNSDKVDFVALAKPYLQNHNLTQFLQTPYTRHFRSE